MLPQLSAESSLGAAAYAVPLPRRGEVDQLVHESVCYAAPSGHRPLFLDLHVPRPATPGAPAPVVVWLHGGSWSHGSRRRFPRPFEEHWFLARLLLAGWAVATVDHRLVRDAPFPAAVDDARAAVAWLGAHAVALGLDPGRFVLWGESAGAHVALLAGATDGGTTPPVRAVVDWYGPTDLTALLGTAADADELPALMLAGGWAVPAASPLHAVGPDAPPVLLVHGRDDPTVPVAQSRALATRLAELGVPAELVETDGGHVFEGSDAMPGAIAASLGFLARVCGSPARPGTPAPGLLRRVEVRQEVLAGRAVDVRELRRASPSVAVLDLVAGPLDDAAAERALRLAEVIGADVLQVGCAGVPDVPALAAAAATRLPGPGHPVLSGGGAALVAGLDGGLAPAALLLTGALPPVGTSRLRGLCPVLVGVGGDDPELDGTLALVHQLRAAGVPNRLRVTPGLTDPWAGARAREQLVRALAQLLDDGTLA